MVGSFFLYKRMLAEQDLNSDWWNIEFKDITFPTVKTGQKSSLSLLSEDGARSGKSSALRTVTQFSSHSLISASGKFDSVLVGAYKGVKIAYKPLHVKKIDINRRMLNEFRQVCYVIHFQFSITNAPLTSVVSH